MSASADIETNTNGLVVIHYLTKLDWSKLDRIGIWQIAKFQQCLPYKFRAAHICDTNTQGGGFYQAIFIKTLDAISRVRILYHPGERGSSTEAVCTLNRLAHDLTQLAGFTPKQDLISKLSTSYKHLAYRNEYCL